MRTTARRTTAPIDGEDGRAPADVPLRELLAEDLATHLGRWSSPGFQALAVHRVGTRLRSMPRPVRRVVRRLHRAAYVVVRNVYGIELPSTTTIGRRVQFAHQSGIVVHGQAHIGDDCVIRHNVTLGAAVGDARWARQAPRLGRGVSVGVGAVLVGAVDVGDGASIGPNVTVLRNVPAGARVMAQAPRVMKLPAAVADREEQMRARP